MNIKELIKTYKLDLITACKVLNISPNSLQAQTGKKDVRQLTIQQMINLHQAFGLSCGQIANYDFGANNDTDSCQRLINDIRHILTRYDDK